MVSHWLLKQGILGSLFWVPLSTNLPVMVCTHVPLFLSEDCVSYVCVILVWAVCCLCLSHVAITVMQEKCSPVSLLSLCRGCICILTYRTSFCCLPLTQLLISFFLFPPAFWRMPQICSCDTFLVERDLQLQTMHIFSWIMIEALTCSFRRVWLQVYGHPVKGVFILFSAFSPFFVSVFAQSHGQVNFSAKLHGTWLPCEMWNTAFKAWHLNVDRLLWKWFWLRWLRIIVSISSSRKCVQTSGIEFFLSLFRKLVPCKIL